MNFTKSDLEQTAKAMVIRGKGILAADESLGTIGKRFSAIGIESTPETRRTYRELLFTTTDIEKYISSVIMFDETIRQNTHKGIPFPEYLSDRGIFPGIKVDKGAKPIPGFQNQQVTEGLDGLRERLSEYTQLGARFAKWRAVIDIDGTIPSRYCIKANAYALARYAALCQEAGLVPIVEPEVLMKGKHDIARCEEVTTDVLSIMFTALHEQKVMLEGCIIKPNMVVPGKDSGIAFDTQEISNATLRTLYHTVPAAVPGIAFLSGGQKALTATANLDKMNRIGSHPWALTFSFARALQDPVLESWQGKPENMERAQRLFLHRAHCNSAASKGEYTEAIEREFR